MLGRLLRHTSTYTLGSVLVTLAGFISFPILTRLLSVEDYGVLSLISATLAMLVGVGKLGVQHSIVRFYSEVRAGKRAAGAGEFTATVVYGMGAIGLAISLAWVGATQLVPAAWWNNPHVKGLLLLTSGLVFLRVLDSAFINLLRAQERSAAYTAYSVIRRYGVLALVLATMLTVLPGLRGFYVGTLIGEALVVAGLAVYVLRGEPVRPSALSLPLLRAMLMFGMPMIAYEIAGIVLSLGDRYVIQALIGAEALGVYAAAYNLCEYVQAIVLAAFATAVVPMYTRVYDEQGAEPTRKFIAQVLHVYVLLGAAVVAGLAAVAPELITVLATSKFSAGASIVPWVIAGLVVDGAINLFGAGLYLHKRTRTIMGLVLAAAVVNLLLNLWWVPALGINGAAAATLVSYLGLTIATTWAGRSLLRIELPWRALGKFGLLAVAMYAAVASVSMSGPVTTLLVKIVTGALVYAVLVLAFDAESRRLVRLGIARLSAGAPAARGSAGRHGQATP